MSAARRDFEDLDRMAREAARVSPVAQIAAQTIAPPRPASPVPSVRASPASARSLQSYVSARRTSPYQELVVQAVAPIAPAAEDDGLMLHDREPPSPAQIAAQEAAREEGAKLLPRRSQRKGKFSGSYNKFFG